MEREITDLSAMVWKRLKWYISALAAPQEAAAARRSALVTIPAALRGGANQRSVEGVPTAAGALRASQPSIRGLRCARLPDYHGKTIVKLVLQLQLQFCGRSTPVRGLQIPARSSVTESCYHEEGVEVQR